MKSFLYKMRIRFSVLLYRINGKAQHASNDNYKIHKTVFKQILAGGLVADELLPKVDNEQQRELLELVCSAANKRVAGQVGGVSAGGSASDTASVSASGSAGGAATDTFDTTVEKIKSYIADNMQYMTTEFLDRIEQISISSGLFVYAYTAREQNELLILKRASTGASFSKRNAVRLFWSYINRDEDEAARQMLKRRGIFGNPVTSRHIRSLCFAFGLLPKNPKKPPAFLKKTEHAAFAEYIKNKRIAIVGPALSETDHSEELKRDFDIVLQMNYRGSASLPALDSGTSQRSPVSRISYYRKQMNAFISNPDENVDFLSDLDFAVFKQSNDKTLSRTRGHTKARAVKVLPDFFFLGRYSMVQLILQDLLQFEPARVKVFNITLDLSETLYAKGYKTSEVEHKTLNQWLQMSSHNLVSQYDYMRNLYKRGLVDADTRLSEILNLGTAEYMKQMQEQENRKPLFHQGN